MEATIAADGTFVLHNVAGGHYTVAVIRRLQSSSYNPVPVASATMGARDVLKDGLDPPWKADEVLKIKVACSGQGVRQ
jgi:hypothetical protein